MVMSYFRHLGLLSSLPPATSPSPTAHPGTRKRMRMMDTAPSYSYGCSPSPSKRLRRRSPRVVSFVPGEGVSPKDGLTNVREDVKVFHPDNTPSMWWSRAERNGICTRARRVVSIHNQQHVDQIEDMLDVFDRLLDECAAEHEDDDEDDEDYDDDEDLPEASTIEPECTSESPIVIPTHARGLEWGFVPSIKNRRRIHAKTVLDAQDDLADADTLGAKAARSSRPSRIFAHLVGQGDATQAVEDKAPAFATTILQRHASVSDESSEDNNDHSDSESESDSENEED